MARANRDRDANYWIEAARATATNPDAWLYAADMLQIAAQEVLEAHQRTLEEWSAAFEEARTDGLAGTLAEIQVGFFLTPVYLLLSGLAIENLVKGAAVAKDPELVTPNQSGKIVTWGHINSKLFTDLDVDLNGDETTLVDRLSGFVQWAGRYPAPRFARELSSDRSFMFPDATIAIDSLFDRLRGELVEASALHQERLAQERVEHGSTCHAELSRLPTRMDRGVTYFVDDTQPNEVGSWTACAACGLSFGIAPHTPAAICGCGDFHYGWEWYDGSLRRTIFRTDVLRRDEIS